ncbi:uncharacterized protein [Procambarus clarkii]|uniref:uncharacterized protein n=1 Tax=Procambarus clarkii TaxID=6728 RepID=UPI0037444DFA
MIMSKVRPSRSPQPSPGTSQLVVLAPKKTPRLSMAASSGGATTASEDTMLKPAGNFGSDGGYGAINPQSPFTGRAAMPLGLPEPLKPIVPTSYSMPTLATTITSLMSPQQTHTDVFYNAVSFGGDACPLSPNLSPPPNTPLSPLSIPSSPKHPATRTSPKIPCYNLQSPSIITPPNTPMSPVSSIASPQPERDKYFMEPMQFPDSSAVSDHGPLYNILSPDLVDLTNLRPFPKANPKFPSDPTHGTRDSSSYSAYPSHYFADHNGNAEEVIKDLVNLGNGMYDGGNEERLKYKKIQEPPSKSRAWDSLEEKETLVEACWNHNLSSFPDGRSDSTAKNSECKPSKTHKSLVETSSRKKKKHKNRRTAPNLNECNLGAVEDDVDHSQHKRRSRFRKLKIPMIDDDDSQDCRKPDSDVTTSTSDSSSSSIDILGPGAVQLAEQLCDEVQEGINYLTEPEDTLEFGWIDALTGVISIVAFYFDLVSDALVAYYMRDDPAAKNWFLATLLLIILPMVVANGFSLYWYWFDERSCEPRYCPRHPRVPNYVWVFRVAAHLLLQAPALRQADIIYYGTKSTAETALQEALVDEVMEAALVSSPQDLGSDALKDARSLGSSSKGLSRSSTAASKRPVSACSVRTGGMCSPGGYVALWIHAERDAANVELLLALVQDAPLLILHLYVVAHTLPSQALQGHISDTLVMQLLSVTMSLLTLAWSVASFVRASRLTEPSLGNLSILDLLLLTLSHFCSIARQVMSFSLFASKLVVAFFITVTVHWLVMSSWILIQLLCFPRTTCTRAFFSHDRQRGLCHWLDDVFYSAVMGLVFLFTFIDVGGIAARTQNLLYHVMTLVEEMILLAIWLVWVSGWSWYHWAPLVLSPVLFCLSLIFDALFTAHAKPNQCLLLNSSPRAV